MDLVKEFKDTRNISQTAYKKWTKALIKDTEIYEGDIKTVRPLTHTIPLEFIRGGTVSVGYDFVEDGTIVSVLNFADALTPGGLVEVGGTTQEENICRCTNLYESLTCKKALRDYYNENTRHFDKVKKHLYLDNIIYSRDVVVFKDDITYEQIEPRFFDVITCPAPATMLEDGKALQVYIKRIEQIVLSAIKNDVDVLVLGAWGCGAFGQDPYLVAAAFATVLNKYSGYFDKVIFAIRPTPTYKDKITKDESTFDIFVRVMEEYYKGEVIING